MKIFLPLLLLICSFTSYGQSKRDSLYTVWQDEAEPDSVRIRAYSKFLFNYYVYSNPDSASILVNDLLKFSEDHKYPMARAFANNIKSTIAYMRSDLDTALVLQLKSLAIYKELDYKKGIANTLNNCGVFAENLGDYASALDYYIECVKIREEMNEEEEKSKTLNNIGVLYDKQGDHVKALNYYLQSLKIREKLNDKGGIAASLYNIGVVYRVLGDPDEALNHYERSLEMFIEIDDLRSIATCYNTMAVIYRNGGDYKKAMSYYQKGLDLFDSIGNPLGKAKSMEGIGQVYRALGDFDNSQKYFNKSLAINREAGDKSEESASLIDLGYLYLEQGNHSKAQEYCNKAYILSIELGALNQQIENCKCLYKSYKAQGKSKKALEYHELLTVLQDSLYDKETIKKLEQTEFAIKTYKDSLERDKENRILEAAHVSELNEKKRTQNLMAVSGLFVVLLLSFVFYNKVRTIRLEKRKVEAMAGFKAQMFAEVSHEFRTPLSLIMGPIKTVEETVEDQKSRSLLHMAYSNAEQLLKLVDQQLEVSSIEATGVEFNSTPADVNSVVKQIADSFRPLAEERSIEYKVNIPEQETLISMDTEKMKIIVNNILSNAFKFTKAGEQVSLSVSEQDDSVNIVIEDTGVGIPPEDQHLIFERYFHTENVERKGSGIGLALVKDYVKLHKGEIALESKPEVGSKFTLKFPKFEAGKLSSTVISSQDQSEISTGLAPTINTESITAELLKEEKPKLLLVEDNEELSIFIRQALEDEFDVEVAYDGEEGLDKAFELNADFIITDVMMPKMDGYELLKALKKDKRSCLTPVLVLTAKATLNSKIKGLGLGADGYLVKPFVVKELKATIENILTQRKFIQTQITETLGLLSKSDEKALNPLDKALIVKVMTFISENLENGELGADTIAEEVGLSTSHLNRKAKEITGLTVGKLIIAARLEKAVELLRSRQYNVSEVADMTGFGGSAYFVKCFRNKYGVTPGAWQKQ